MVDVNQGRNIFLLDKQKSTVVQHFAETVNVCGKENNESAFTCHLPLDSGRQGDVPTAMT